MVRTWGSVLRRSPWALMCLGLLGCGDGEAKRTPEPSAAERFMEAATLEASWCVKAQRIVAGLSADAALGERVVQVDYESDDFVASRADIQQDELALPALAIAYPDAQEPGPAELTREIDCKLRTQAALTELLELPAAGSQASCGAVNQAALDWAMAQLTDAERERYEESGARLQIADDQQHALGPSWIQAHPVLSAVDDGYTLAASALVSEGDDFSDATMGAHYCKLWTPAHMLYWLLVRAFEAAPLEDEVAPDPEACTPRSTMVGSCIFFFAVAEQHFCEEYTGTGFSAESAEAKCQSREEGVFASAPCSARASETSTLDGDGEYKGACVLKCGTSEEYIWRIYSEPTVGTPASGCPDDWFGPEIPL